MQISMLEEVANGLRNRGIRMLLSIVTKDKTLTQPIQRELLGVDYELINDSWVNGLKIAEGKFVCFLEEGSDFRGGFFIRGMLNMLANPNFRKLAVVAPAVEDFNGRGTLYQLDITGDRAWDEMRSINPYPVQVGYIPGAIIRTSALKQLNSEKELKNYTTPADLSAAICLKLWETGQMVHVDPRMTYLTDITTLTDAHQPSQEVEAIWKRQSI